MISMSRQEYSLVSVLVVTYNSGQYVEETLESVYKQSWPNLELVITDDYSKDNTIAICKEWLSKNRDRFTRTVIVESDMNTGVPSNLNRGLQETNGEWLTFPAGDDTLKPDCIKENMDWIASRPEIKVLLSGVDVYNDTFKPENYISTTPLSPIPDNSIVAKERNASEQYQMLLTSDRIHFTPSLFLNRKTLISIGSFDERFRLLEDYPLWLNLTKNGHKLEFMDKSTVNYRKHSMAINNNAQNTVVNLNYFELESFRRIYTYPNLPLDIRLSQRYEWIVKQLFRVKYFNRKTGFNQKVLMFLTVYFNPFKYMVWLHRKTNTRVKNSMLYNS